MKQSAAAVCLLLLVCCSGLAQGQRLLNRLGATRCQGIAPAPVTGLQAKGANGMIYLAWQPSACATSYAVTVDRDELKDNTLSFNVTGTQAAVRNVANGSPYTVQVAACNGSLCSAKTTTKVTPDGSVTAAPVGTVVPAASTASFPRVAGWSSLVQIVPAPAAPEGQVRPDKRFRPY